VVGANGDARRTVALRAAEVRPARDEMGSTPSREHDVSSESGARTNITVVPGVQCHARREPV
jgi:hypothetical protein